MPFQVNAQTATEITADKPTCRQEPVAQAVSERKSSTNQDPSEMDSTRMPRTATRITTTIHSASARFLAWVLVSITSSVPQTIRNTVKASIIDTIAERSWRRVREFDRDSVILIG
jgi:hypothetical protein